MSSDSLTVELPSFFCKRNAIQSHKCAVVAVYAETPKSFDVLLKPVFEKRSACWRCGKPISNEHSVFWGVGPDCATKMGLPWQELPTDRPDAVTETRVYLPKSFLDPSEMVLLRSWIDSDASGEDRKIHQAKLIKKGSRLYLESPYVNKSFVDALAQLPDRKWDRATKTNTFTATQEALAAVLNVLSSWSVIVNVDDSLEQMMAEHRHREQVAQAATESFGVTSIADLKYAEIGENEYDWGLKTTPWLHQRQAILYTAATWGVSLKKSEE